MSLPYISGILNPPVQICFFHSEDQAFQHPQLRNSSHAMSKRSRCFSFKDDTITPIFNSVIYRNYKNSISAYVILNRRDLIGIVFGITVFDTFVRLKLCTQLTNSNGFRTKDCINNLSPINLNLFLICRTQVHLLLSVCLFYDNASKINK